MSKKKIQQRLYAIACLQPAGLRVIERDAPAETSESHRRAARDYATRKRLSNKLTRRKK